jgi:hypothetical protein
MPASAKALGPATRKARGSEILHLADHRRLDALAGADEVDRFLPEVAGALGGNQDQGAAAIGHQAALQQAERVTAVVDDDEQMFGRLAGILWSTETPIL